MIWLVWIGLAIILCVAIIAARLTTPLYAYGLKLEQMPIAAFAFGYVFICFLFFMLLPLLVRASTMLEAKHVLFFMIIVGAVARLGFVGGPTILEDDYNRYLWDGAVTASGENPYANSPDEVRESREAGSVFDTLITQSNGAFDRINFPQYSTVYPPAAQLVFALTYIISPFNLDVFRLVLLLFEAGCLALTMAMLRHFQLSPLWAVLYWWNPLVIKEIANSAHMEPLLMLPVLAAGYLALKERFHWASAALAVAAGIKVWPAILAIVIWRQLLDNFRQLILNMLIFCLILGLMVLPIIISGLSKESGFVAFGGIWQASSAMYLVAEWIANNITPYWVDDYLDIPLVSRLLLGIALIVSVSAVCFRYADHPNALLWRMFIIIAAIYLLAPSHTPWYFVWLAPFLCIYPIRGLILTGVLAPFHYFYFHFAARDLHDVYHYGIVWLIWSPVWMLLIAEFGRQLIPARTGALTQ